MFSDPDDPQEGASGLCDDQLWSDIDDSDVDKYFDITEEISKISKKSKKGDQSSSKEEIIQCLKRKKRGKRAQSTSIKGPRKRHLLLLKKQTPPLMVNAPPIKVV